MAKFPFGVAKVLFFLVALLVLYLIRSTFLINVRLTETELDQVVLKGNNEDFVTRSIFFVETSKSSSISPRALCAIESAAKHHSKSQIYYIVPEGTAIDPNFVVEQYSNIMIRPVNFTKLIDETPAYGLGANITKTSKFPLVQLSDVVRVSLLYKYGGTYLDTDTVTLRQLPEDVPNFAGITPQELITNCILRFTKLNPLLKLLLEKMKSHFRPSAFASLGPLMYSSVIKKKCKHRGSWSLVPPEACFNVTFLPTDILTPLPVGHFRKYFLPEFRNYTTEKTQSSWVVHLWNNISKRFKFEKMDKESAIYSMCEKNCPWTFQKYRNRKQ